MLIGSYDGHLYALDPATGKQLWKSATDNYVHATPAIWNGVAYFGGCDEFFHGVRLSRRQGGRSKLATDGYTAASPAIAAGVAYFGHVRQRSHRRGHRREEGEVALRGSRPPVSVLLVGRARERPRRARRPRQERPRDRYGHRQARWSFPTRARVDSSPAIAGDRVVVGSGDGKVYVLDLTTGKKVWEFDAGAAFTASPAIAGGRIVIGDTDGRVYGIGQ